MNKQNLVSIGLFDFYRLSSSTFSAAKRQEQDRSGNQARIFGGMVCCANSTNQSDKNIFDIHSKYSSCFLPRVDFELKSGILTMVSDYIVAIIRILTLI